MIMNEEPRDYWGKPVRIADIDFKGFPKNLRDLLEKSVSHLVYVSGRNKFYALVGTDVFDIMKDGNDFYLKARGRVIQDGSD